MNPAWNSYVNEVVAPRIKKEMCIECSFTPSLYKLKLYKTGSFLKPHRDSEKMDGMFATLIIQLPSQYKGGQLVVRHDGKTITSDFSSVEASNPFSTFFTAFFRDCEHEVLEVTEGYRLCLVYILICHRSEVPIAPQRNALEVQLITLIKDWEYNGKLVYALKHKYSEANLSFDNLKTTDRVIANFLIHMAKANDLHVFLAIFSEESSGQKDYYDYDFDRSHRRDNDRSKSYHLSKLISIEGDNILVTSNLSVNFDKEVIPEDCFTSLELYRKTAQSPGNAGVEVDQNYRSAAIVFWPKQLFLQVLKNGGAESIDLDKVFLQEIEEQRGKVNDDETKSKLLLWANEVITSGGDKSIDVIRAIVEMKDIPLMGKMFSRCVNLNEISTSVLVDVCEKYGWNSFSTQIPGMFQILNRDVAIQLLSQLIGIKQMEIEKKNIVHNVMTIILKKCEDIKPCYAMCYVRTPTMEEKMKKRTEDQDFLLSTCRLAERVSFNMLTFVKTKPFLLFVPVLFRLVPQKSKVLSSFWKEIATYLLQEMEKEAVKPAVVADWRREVKANCSCRDCSDLNHFLANDQESISLKMGKQRRQHLHIAMNRMQDIAHETDLDRPIGLLVIKKMSKTGVDEFEKNLFSKENLKKFRLIIPLQ